MNLEKIDLRNLLRRIAWKRSIIIITTATIAYYLLTHDISFNIPSPGLHLPQISILHHNNPVLSAVSLAMLLISIIAAIKLLRRG